MSTPEEINARRLELIAEKFNSNKTWTSEKENQLQVLHREVKKLFPREMPDLTEFYVLIKESEQLRKEIEVRVNELEEGVG